MTTDAFKAADRRLFDQRARRRAPFLDDPERCATLIRQTTADGLASVRMVSAADLLTGWLAELGAPTPPVRPLPINDIAPGVPVDGPAAELEAAVRALHVRRGASA